MPWFRIEIGKDWDAKVHTEGVQCTLCGRYTREPDTYAWLEAHKLIELTDDEVTVLELEGKLYEHGWTRP
jgi:hypothetical protein